MASFIPHIQSHWNHNIDGLQFSALEFYDRIEQGIKSRNFPDVKMKRILLSQGGLFSSNREYLRVWRGDDTFDICAAPFGTTFFVSWWSGERLTGIKEWIAKIPYLGPFVVAVTKPSTYYQIDTQNMFKSAVHSSVLAALDELTQTKGLRGLSDLERQVQAGSKK